MIVSGSRPAFATVVGSAASVSGLTGLRGPQSSRTTYSLQPRVAAEPGPAPIAQPDEYITRVKTYVATVLKGQATDLLLDKPLAEKINFRILKNEVNQVGADVVITRDSVRMVKDKFANTLYGYFLGDRLAFPVVDYFVRLNWKKFGLQKTMMNTKGFFFFKFNDRRGMMDVLDTGPLLIRNKPIFLNIWSPATTLNKDDIKTVPVWFKLHNVPIVAYSDDGLSLLATKIGTPKHLDAHTSSMCRDVWGQCSYARSFIEISTDNALKDHLMVVISDEEGDTFVQVRVDVEFEWTPPRCGHCCVFAHNSVDCPKHVKPTATPTPTVVQQDPKANGDGSKGKKVVKHTTGQTTKKAHVEWRPVVGKSRRTRKKIHTLSTSVLRRKLQTALRCCLLMMTLLLILSGLMGWLPRMTRMTQRFMM